MAGMDEPPCGRFRLMSAYPQVKPTNVSKLLSDFADKPTVVHLYTG